MSEPRAEQRRQAQWAKHEPYFRLNRHFPTWGDFIPTDFSKARVCIDLKAEMLREEEAESNRAKPGRKARHAVRSPAQSRRV